MQGPRARWWLGLVVGVIVPAACAAPVDFSHDIVPIIKARCAECHTNGKYKSGLSLDTREDLLRSKAVVPGKSAASELFKRVGSKDKDFRMPPKGEPLTAKEVALLRAWIDEGLAWDAGFTFKASTYVAPLKPRRPTLPPVRPGLEHPIDRIVAAYYAQHKAFPKLMTDLTSGTDQLLRTTPTYVDLAAAADGTLTKTGVDTPTGCTIA